MRKVAVFYVFQMSLYLHTEMAPRKNQKEVYFGKLRKYIKIDELWTLKLRLLKETIKKQTRQFIHKIVQAECCLTGVPCKHLKAIRNKELANLLRNRLYSLESGPFPKSGHNRYG